MNAPPPEQLLLDRLDTPIGQALVVVDEAGRLRAFDWADSEARLVRLLRRHYATLEPRPGQAPAAMRDAIDDYFEGALDALDLIECALPGDGFSPAVWRALRGIPAGQTLSYGALATRLGRPRAVRAVGRANGANPISLVAPCHRVIGANGALTGYAGGVDRKRWLLRHEGVESIESGLAKTGVRGGLRNG